MDDFNILTEEDKSHVSYGACVGGMALTGVAVGRFVGVQGVLAGAVAGAAWGLLTCKRLQEPIKRKLFSRTSKLSEHEVTAALRAIRTGPSMSKERAIQLLAQVRHEIPKRPDHYKGALG